MKAGNPTFCTSRNGSRDDARFAVKYDARFAVTPREDEKLELTSSSAMMLLERVQEKQKLLLQRA